VGGLRLPVLRVQASGEATTRGREVALNLKAVPGAEEMEKMKRQRGEDNQV